MAHLEKESIEKEEGTESEDPDGNKGVTEEFLVCLTRAVKYAQQEEKCCYHCSSLKQSTEKEEGTESKDPGGNKGVTEEFIVCLTRAVKDAQQEEKCCYHSSSLKHFIHDCALVKTSRTDSHLN